MQVKHQLAAAVFASLGEASAVRSMPYNAIQLNVRLVQCTTISNGCSGSGVLNRIFSKLLPALLGEVSAVCIPDCLIDSKTGFKATAQTCPQSLPLYTLTSPCPCEQNHTYNCCRLSSMLCPRQLTHAGNAGYFGRQEFADTSIHLVCISWVVKLHGRFG